MWTKLLSFAKKSVKKQAIKKMQENETVEKAVDIYTQIQMLGCLMPVFLIALKIVTVIVVISIIISPLVYINSYTSTISESFKNGWEVFSNIVTFRCVGTNKECEEKEKNKFYDSLKKVGEQYQRYGIELDLPLLAATLTFNDMTEGFSENENLNPDEMGEIEDFYEETTDYKEARNRIKKLVSHMVKRSQENVCVSCEEGSQGSCGEGECEELRTTFVLDLEGYEEYLRTDFLRNAYFDGKTGKETDLKIEDAIAQIYGSTEFYKWLMLDKISEYSQYNLVCDKIDIIGGPFEGTYALEDYVAGVVQAEVGGYNQIEAFKALAIAARTYVINATDNCTKPIENSTYFQTFVTPTNPLAIQSAKDTAGLILTYDKKIFSSEYDSLYSKSSSDYSCSNGFCEVTYTKLPNKEKHVVRVPESLGRQGEGHGRGMSQVAAYYYAKELKKNHEEILKIFYSDGVEITSTSKMFSGAPIGGEGIFSEIIFPVGWAPLNEVCMSAGKFYPSGKVHNAIDLSCNRLGYSGKCTKIPIIAARGGKIISLNRGNRCNRLSYVADNETGPLIYDPSSKSCPGNGMTILIVDESSPLLGHTFRYNHFDQVDPNLKVGDMVETGQVLGVMGNTGNSTGYHLHFQLNSPTKGPIIMDEAFKNYCKVVAGGN